MKPISPSFAILIALFQGTQAVVVCSGYSQATRGCEPPCTNLYISLDQEINTPGTNCIYNSAQDGGFNMRVCSGPYLSGPCSNLQDLPREEITGDFNWYTPNTGSVLRTGN